MFIIKWYDVNHICSEQGIDDDGSDDGPVSGCAVTRQACAQLVHFRILHEDIKKARILEGQDGDRPQAAQGIPRNALGTKEV